MRRPKKDEYSPFHAAYIRLLPPKGTALSLLKKTFRETSALLSDLPEEAGEYTYSEGKWTIKQVLMHLTDAERVFACRALWFMRADRAPLPGFNQDFWMEYADVSKRTVKDLLKEWKTVRDNTIHLVSNCSDEQSLQTGTAGNFKVSARACFYIIIGHHLHHLEVLKERYLSVSDAAPSPDSSM